MRIVALLANVVIAGGLVLATAAGAFGLILALVALLHADALRDHRLPWLSWPLMLALDGYILWFTITTTLEERRQRRELPAKIRAFVLRCPLCQEPLPAWEGAFEECPYPRLHAQGGPGPPAGDFRLHCPRCDCDVWFSAWLDGKVFPNFSWALHVKYKHLL